jgi:Tfp pilus assembly protein PilV
MKIRCSIAVLILAVLVLGASRLIAQASVNENESMYIYVSASSGSDSYPGTQSEPLKTISAAVVKAEAYNRNGAGTRVMIEPGVYRETVNIMPTYGQTGAAMTFQATTTGEAIIAGSNQLTGWYSIGGGQYAHSWSDTVGPCSEPSGWPSGLQPIVLHREMVFVNNAPMTQVLSPAEMRPGTFYVDSQYQQLHVYPPSGTNMGSALVEVATRPQTLEVYGRSNIVFRGLVFRHAASCINEEGAVVSGTNNILFDHVQAIWNNWGGLGIDSSNHVTVQYSTGSYNGGVGLFAYETQNALYQSNETDYNNWRGAQGNFYNWAMGGTKLMRMRSTTVNQHYSYNNAAQGLWFDTDNKDVTVNGAIISGNLVANLQIEKNEGPITIENSKIASGDVGLQLVNTAYLTVKGSTFYNNGGAPSQQAQFFLAGAAGGESFTDWQTGQYYNINTDHTTFYGNTFMDASYGQYVFNTYVSGSTWSDFKDTLSSSDNYWFDPTKLAAFILPGGAKETFNGWQSWTGQDYSSHWESNSGALSSSMTAPYPSFTDFNVYRANLRNEYYTNYMYNGSVSIPLQVKSFGYGAVYLSVIGLPSGVSAYFSPSVLTSGNTTLTLKASSYSPTETVPITVIGTSGSRVHTVTMMVYVKP